MKSSHTDKIIDRLSLKYNLPPRVIRFIINSQFEFLRNSMQSGTPGEFETFVSIRLRFFGIWKVQRKKLMRISGQRENKLKRQQEEHESLYNKKR